MNQPSTISGALAALLLVGGGMLVIATVLALRPRAPESGFGWIVIAGFANCLLGLAAALQFRESNGLPAGLVAGLHAAGLQLAAVLLAALLWSLSPPSQTEATSRGDAFTSATRGLAWLTLLGLPPTVGFHAKVVLYRALAAAGWGALAVLVAAASIAALFPALWTLRSPPPQPLRGFRALIAALLVALIVALGVYPQFAMGLGDIMERLAGSAVAVNTIPE